MSITRQPISFSQPRGGQSPEVDEAELLCFRFTDLAGRWLQFFRPNQGISLNDGINFSVLASGWRLSNNSDYLFRPDPDTRYREPSAPVGTTSYVCDVYESNGTAPYERDPRLILKAAKSHLSDVLGEDACFQVGLEFEFYLFEDIRLYSSNGEATIQIVESEGIESVRPGFAGTPGYSLYHSNLHLSPTVDRHHAFRLKAAKNLLASGLRPISYHHEAGPSQCEIGIEHMDILAAADAIQKTKDIIRKTAQSEGRIATFMPRPLAYSAGSGLHLNLSIVSGGKNLFAGDKPGELSETARRAMGGILQHARALNCFLNPTPNSYRRLEYMFGSHTPVGYGFSDRTTAIRIPPFARPAAARIEARFGDASLNPYLALAALALACLDGIEQRIEPGEPAAAREWSRKTPQLWRRPDTALARDLEEALVALDRDRGFLTASGIFKDDLVDAHLLELSRRALDLIARPHPHEFYEGVGT